MRLNLQILCLECNIPFFNHDEKMASSIMFDRILCGPDPFFQSRADQLNRPQIARERL
jgi:hypothetical protein